MTSMSVEARAEYLKRYLDPPKEKKKKKTKDAKNFRIIEEDTFLPIKEEKAAKKQKVSDSEDEADALLRAAQNAKELEATKFKAGTFVSVNDGSDEAQPSNVIIAKPNCSQPVLRTSRTRDRRGEDLDASPLRRQAGRLGNDSDASPSRPLRLSGRRADNPDISPPRRRPGKGSDSDASPPRRRNADGHKRRGSDSDASPPRRRYEKDRSPMRRRIKREALDCDLDHSPPRNEPRRSSQSPTRVVVAAKVERRSDSDKSPAVSDDDEEGCFAAPRKRVTLFNRRRRNGKEPEDPEKKARESAKQKEWDAKYAQWSKGIEQTKEREARLKEMSKVAQESFTRYPDDEAMNAYLKEQIYDLDPMANFYRTKQQKIEMKTSVVYPKYTGHWPPNRFGIAPGYRWDGVDRSNGFETKMAGAENRRKAEETIAYRSITECEE